MTEKNPEIHFEIRAIDDVHEEVFIIESDRTFRINPRQLETYVLQHRQEIDKEAASADILIPERVFGNINDGHKTYFLRAIRYLLANTDKLLSYKQ